MAKKDTKRFLFNCDWQDTLNKLPDSSRLKVFDAVIDYVRNNHRAELDLAESITFDFICKEIDWNNDKYEEICKMRSEAGKRGGAPKGNQNASKNKQNNQMFDLLEQNKQNKQKQAKTSKTNYNDNEDENKNENMNNNELSNDNNKEDVLTNMEEREKPKKKIFVKPTIEEVAERMREKGYTGFTAEQFWNFYESKGWMVGKNPMKDWRAALVTWVTGERRSGRARAEELLHFPGENDPHAFDKDAEMYNKRH